MKTLRSLLVIPRYWPAVGGAELHTRELAQRLSRHHSVGVVHHCSNEATKLELAAAMSQPQQYDDGNIQVHQLTPKPIIQASLQKLASQIPRHRSARKLYNVLFQRGIQSQLDAIANDFDLIHSVYNGLTASTEAAIATAHKQGKPFVWTPLAHIEEPVGTAWSSTAFRKLYARADALITMTQYEKDFLIDMGANANKVHVCPVSALLEDNADPHSYRDSMKLGDFPVVLFLGRHVAEKGYRQLAEAAKIIWKSHAQTRFLFIGPNDQESDAFFSRIKDPRIIRQSHISDVDKCSALAACDLLCVPSTKESLGVIYLEAWHYAKPVVAADIPVLHTVINHQHDGLLCAQHPASIAESIIRLLSDPQLRTQMGLAGQVKVRTRYNWERIADTMHDVYVDLIRNHHLKKRNKTTAKL